MHPRDAVIGRHPIGLSFWHVLGPAGRAGYGLTFTGYQPLGETKNLLQGHHFAVNGLEAGGQELSATGRVSREGEHIRLPQSDQYMRHN